MKRSIFGALCIVFLLVGCSKQPGDSFADGPFKVSVGRGSSNQLSVRLTRSDASGVNAARDAGALRAADARLIFEQGYRMASDRFPQMDGARRFAQARQSELFGVVAEKQDREIIAVGLPLAVRNTSQLLQREYPETYELLRAFARGVNKFLAEVAKATPEPPIVAQYRAITRDPDYRLDSEEAQWTPDDCIGSVTNVGFYLQSALPQKVSMGIMAAAKLLMGQYEEAVTMFDFRPIAPTYILGARHTPPVRIHTRAAAAAAQIGAHLQGAAALDYKCVERGYPFPECERPSAVGSNSWAVSREFAGGDTAYVANDPHLAISYPNITYPVELLDSKSAGGTFKLTGLSLVGMPGILIGHNDRLGYGFTNFSSDAADAVYILKLNQARTQAQINGRWVAIGKYTFPLKVRDVRGKPQSKVVELSYVPDHGVIFSDHFSEVKSVLQEVEKLNTPVFGKHIAMSYQWTGHRGTREIEAVFARLNRAQTPADVDRALEVWDAGTQNVVYADVDGNIGYGAHGLFPIREDLSSLNPPNLLINPSESDVRWKRYQTRFPNVKNPAAGFIVTANNDPFGDSHDFSRPDRYYGYGFSTGIRAKRITDLLTAKRGNVVLEDMRRIQMDHRAELEDNFIQLVEKSRVRDQLTGVAAQVADALFRWDRQATRDRIEPTYAAAWADVALAEHFKYRRGNIPAAILQMIPQAQLNLLLEKIENQWNAVAPKAYRTSLGIKTLYHAIKEGLSDPAKPEFERTVAFLKVTFDRTAEQLQQQNKLNAPWGEFNRLNFYNAVAAYLPGAFTYSIARDGSSETVDPSWGGVVGATFRLVMAFKRGQPIQSYLSMPGWNSPPSQKEKLIQEITDWRDGVLTRLR